MISPVCFAPVCYSQNKNRIIDNGENNPEMSYAEFS